MKTLKISETFTLPADFITQCSTIFGTRGSGKTYLAMKMVEEVQRLELPCVIIDFTGVWWGLTIDADGESEGLPLIIVGESQQAQLPAPATSGARVAQIFKDARQNMILDVSAWKVPDRCTFIADFLNELYVLHRDGSPLWIVADEIHQYAPQSTGGKKEIKASLEALTLLATTGRARGFGLLGITQRPALINNGIWSQSETLISGRITFPDDRGKVKEWISGNAPSKQAADEAIDAIDRLPKKQAVICSAMADPVYFSDPDLAEFKHIQVKASRRITYDSSNSAKVSSFARINPKPIDPKKLQEMLAIAQTEDEDDGETTVLRRRIDFLQQQLQEKDSQRAPVDLGELKTVLSAIEEQIKALARVAETLGQEISINLPKIELNLNSPAEPEYKIWQSDRKISLSPEEERILSIVTVLDEIATLPNIAIAACLDMAKLEAVLEALEQKGALSRQGDLVRSTQAVPPIKLDGIMEPWRKRVGRSAEPIIDLIVSGQWREQFLREADIARLIPKAKPGRVFQNLLEKLKALQLLQAVENSNFYYVSPVFIKVSQAP